MKKYSLIPVFALMVFGMTGFALAGTTDDGTITFTITGTTSVSFTTDSVAFGSGAVTSTPAVLNSNGTITGGTWGAYSSGGLDIQNDGSGAIVLSVQANETAADLIGGTSPSIKFKMTDTDEGCTGDALSDYTSIGTDSTQLCSSLSSGSSVELDVELTIPSDATFDSNSLKVTATASAA